MNSHRFFAIGFLFAVGIINVNSQIGDRINAPSQWICKDLRGRTLLVIVPKEIPYFSTEVLQYLHDTSTKQPVYYIHDINAPDLNDITNNWSCKNSETGKETYSYDRNDAAFLPNDSSRAVSDAAAIDGPPMMIPMRRNMTMLMTIIKIIRISAVAVE